MNPSNSHIPPAELPPVAPNNESGPLPELPPTPKAGPETEQQLGIMNEQPQQGPAPDPQATPADQPAADPIVPPMPTPPPPTDGGTPPAATPAIADDTDLIEKEWVLKAKQIVMQTRDDPYQQNKEVSKLKADYVRTRFNKDIKLSDD